MVLNIGEKYKKADFGITGIEKRWSEITVGGLLFTFFSIFDKYNNCIEDDGFVYEGRGEYSLISRDTKSNLQRHVFLKEEEGSYYTFLGVGKCEIRYDEKRNKIIW